MSLKHSWSVQYVVITTTTTTNHSYVTEDGKATTCHKFTIYALNDRSKAGASQ